MHFYKQRYQYDCFLAATATALQRDYDELWSKEFQERIEANKGSGNGLQFEGMALAGLTRDVHYTSTPLYVRPLVKGHARSITDLFWGRRALLQVPSLNTEGHSHMVLLMGGQLFDPSNKKTYDSVEDLTSIEWVTLFNEIDPYSPARWRGDNGF